MARDSKDREDLLRDATAFTTRVQLSLETPDRRIEVFAGLRKDGAASFYFDQDPVYHFNRSGKLRRAFVADSLLKAESGRLVRWTRQPSTEEVVMLRHELTGDQQHELCRTADERLSQLRQSIVDGTYTLVGAVPSDQVQDALDAIQSTLRQLPRIEIADGPGVAG